MFEFDPSRWFEGKSQQECSPGRQFAKVLHRPQAPSYDQHKRQAAPPCASLR